jgi:hypothetical protein
VCCKHLSPEPAWQHLVRIRVVRVVLEHGSFEVLGQHGFTVGVGLQHWLGERVAKQRQRLTVGDAGIVSVVADARLTRVTVRSSLYTTSPCLMEKDALVMPAE